MRRLLDTSAVLRRLCLALGAAALLAAAPAGAATVPLDVEFDTGMTGDFGSVEVLQSGDNLDFTVMLNATESGLGTEADLNEFYFNLVPEVSAIAVTSTDSVNTPYTLTTGPVRGGAGAEFDWGVNFGDGAGPPGNDTLQTASFTISADKPLLLSDLSEQSFPNNVDTDATPILFAAHVQSTDTVFGGDSETVGGGTPTGVIPEPGTALLLGSGLGGLALAGRRRRR